VRDSPRVARVATFLGALLSKIENRFWKMGGRVTQKLPWLDNIKSYVILSKSLKNIYVFQGFQSWQVIFNHGKTYSIMARPIQSWQDIKSFKNICIIQQFQSWQDLFNHIQSWQVSKYCSFDMLFNHGKYWSIVVSICCFDMLFNHGKYCFDILFRYLVSICCFRRQYYINYYYYYYLWWNSLLWELFFGALD
jgi:hypothetical protein